MALRKKRQVFSQLLPDVAVLQEVSELDVSQEPEHCWIGHNRHKGLAVVGRNGYRVRVHPAHDPRIEFVVPIDVSGPVDFLLFAVWIMHNRAVNRIQERPNRWQLLQALEVYEPLLTSRQCVVAGDFNNAVFWDRPGKASNHANAVERLGEFGLASAYHTTQAAGQGHEAHPTLFWMRHLDSTFHIDYLWLPKAWIPGLGAVEVGDYSTWVQTGLSDHVPITVDVDDAVIQQSGPQRQQEAVG
jgi:endonuclease/exonuclease/phosphatase family metal-dependent hydrolase